MLATTMQHHFREQFVAREGTAAGSRRIEDENLFRRLLSFGIHIST